MSADEPALTAGQKRTRTELERREKFFRDKVWDIVAEVHIGKDDQPFLNPFGRPGRHGWLLRERTTGEQITVGYTLLVYIHEKHIGVSLPKALHMQRRRPVSA